jgi:DNA-binding LacI/PurR family transcriptional regulator
VQRVDAILATSQSITMGAVKACNQLGVRVPRQLAILGYDNVPWMELTSPTISTTQQPIEQIAQRACEILFAALASEPAAPRVEVLPSQLVLRASCGCGSS